MFEIKKATRKATPALIALWGPSGSGKTYSALELARGLVGPEGKIGIIDTENCRAEFYADRVGGWYHLDLQPPFTADKYVKAIEKFQSAGGFDCVIVDSMSHVWAGIGGVLEQAEKNTQKGLMKWQKPKTDFNRMVDNLLRSPTHVIFCLRAKNASQQKGGDVERVGMTPICESNFIYEMTASFLLGQDHKPHFENTEKFFNNPEYPAIKAPEDVFKKLKPSEFLSVETGEMIKEWISGGAEYDDNLAALQKIARDVSTMGLDAFRRHWEAISKADRIALEPIKEELKFNAAKADKEAAEQAEQPEANTETTSSLDDDAPATAETPAEEPKEPEKEDEAPAATKTEKPAETATKEPETPEPEKEAAQAATDEKPAEQPETPAAGAPKLILKSSMGDEYKFTSIEAWSKKALAMVEKAGTDKKALDGFNNRHATIFKEMETAYPEQVTAVQSAIEDALKPSVSEPKCIGCKGTGELPTSGCSLCGGTGEQPNSDTPKTTSDSGAESEKPQNAFNKG